MLQVYFLHHLKKYFSSYRVDVAFFLQKAIIKCSSKIGNLMIDLFVYLKYDKAQLSLRVWLKVNSYLFFSANQA